MKTKQTKRLFAFTLVTLLLVSLMGCDTKANSKATTEKESIASESVTVKETTVITTAETETQTTVSEATKATTTIATTKAPVVTTTEKKVIVTTAPVTKATPAAVTTQTTKAATTKAPAVTTTKAKVNPLDYNPDYYARPRVGLGYSGADPGKEIEFQIDDCVAYEITSVKLISAEIQQRFYTSDADVQKATIRYVNKIGNNGTYTYIEPVLYGKSDIPGDYTIEIVLYCKDLKDTVTLTTSFGINPPDGQYKSEEGIVTVYF